ncbi:hypothetical protein FH972_022525 [Carpinus fangiana]|uniref:Dynein heavy chain, cytoplasmic n=1 Tax=Carpinus fangiana TaxID=176857 RepID=A0A5N6KSH6_9ROSI|nr:hypothetical protein FH972_022525 [Carpinus fangiana]
MAELETEGAPRLNGFSAPQSNAAELDPAQLVEYLSRLLSVTLGASEQDLNAPGSLLSPAARSETISRCFRFLNESQEALYAQKQLQADKANGTADAEPPSRHYTYTLTPDLAFDSAATVAAVAILKRPVPLDFSIPLDEQLQILNLPNLNSLDHATTSRFELIHSVVRSALGPYFDAFSKARAGLPSARANIDGEQRSGIPGAKKKLAELELSLLQLQQNAEIPQLSLPLHPVIQYALEQANARGISPTIDLIPAQQLQDSTFHNSLQSVVNGWTRSIQTITKTSRDVTSGTASQEIAFWLDMEKALEDIEEQLKRDGVVLTINVLKNAKRFGATTSFEADTGLKESTDMVQQYNQLMRDFPLNELLSAPSLEKIQEATDTIFLHLNKRLKLCKYPIPRALPLVEAISLDLDHRIHALLQGRTLMQMSYSEFQDIIAKTDAIWLSWDTNVKEFINVAREQTRKRNDRFIPMKIGAHHAQTQDRLKYVANFRHNHEQLQLTIRNVLSPENSNSLEDGDAAKTGFFEEMGDVDAIEEVSEAYAALKNVDVLDITPEGTDNWDRAETIYNERTSRVENSIIARLRDRLATASTANEMFRVFSKFNALFVRPKIRGAISEYQTQLIDNVKNDIVALQERFKQLYGHSQAHAMAQLHDLPPVSGSIIWARQIERQLDAYMKKVEDVLGSQWHQHAEGQKLRTESFNFRKKLDTRVVFQEWLQETTRRNVAIKGRLFDMTRNRAAGNALELSVNFDRHVITLFKEVRNLLWLGFAIPHAINTVSKEARRVYPYAVSLMESVRTFVQADQLINSIPEIALLLSGYRMDVQSQIAKGVPLKWASLAGSYDLHVRPLPGKAGADPSALAARSDSKHVQFVRDFAASVEILQSKTATLTIINETIQQSVARLRTCPYKAEAFQKEITEIQSAVDRLSLENYTNLHAWVGETNAALEAILLQRLEQALAVWTTSFDEAEGLEGQNDISERPLSRDEDGRILEVTPRFETLVHEITMRNSVIYLDPPLDFARSSWLAQLQDWVGVVCDLRKIQASRYEINTTSRLREDQFPQFTDLLARCSSKLLSLYKLVDAKVDEIAEYVGKWLQFQSLWDLQTDQVFETLGDDLSQWLQLLNEIRKTRSTFDTSAANRDFGLLSVEYEQVQSRINQKYDFWQNDILNKFATKLGARINEVFSELEQSRKDLEGSSLEASSTAHAVAFITVVQNARRKVNIWGPEVETFRQGQTTLSRQRFSFPSDWLYVERVEHEWAALNEILERKSKVVTDQTDALRAKILAEDKVIGQRITDITTQWNDQRPVSGSIPAEEASRTLTDFETRLTKLNTEFDMVSKAKEALDLPPAPETGIRALLEEVQDFKSVWAGLSTVYAGLNDLREMPWTSVQPRKLRQSLEGLVNMSKEMPSRMRQYAAFEYLQSSIKQLQKVNPLLTELRSDAVRERHWVRLFKSLKPQKRYSAVSMTLGDVWDLQLGPSEAVIRDVITQAQGEMALEEFLKQVKEDWNNYILDLVNYQSKTKLIRGWDDLFAKCGENLNSLQAMHHSPYYKEFEDEASQWEDRLNRVYVLFDVWIDVQRQWIYLEGVFTGNAEIKNLLPTESNRFQNINSEFFAVMKKVQRAPYVLEVLAIAGVQKQLERLLDLLQKIQKALGEYLERERTSFPRFYFVGDEDLLEIIGNGNDTARIARHLGKMFAGISGLVTEDGTVITGFRSAQGEEVTLRQEVSLAKTPRVNDWLAALERNMQSTLAELLGEAVETFSSLCSGASINEDAFKTYLETFPAQIIVLAGQVWWTNAVEAELSQPSCSLTSLHEMHEGFLRHLAALVIQDLEAIQRKKCEHMITEFVYQRDVIEKLSANNVADPSHYLWLLHMRYVYKPDGELLKRLTIRMADAALPYGFEYLGVPERLVRTPLTDRCFLTMTQALSQKLGGSPYGPAGTGKTETVKALGLQLGRFTLVFCCDDTFDFQAMGRIFLGICQVGAWGCFDEFNRLEERILSAVSQQVQNIQLGLRKAVEGGAPQIDLIGRQVQLHSNTGIFITMNPGYAGRSNLPDNLKKLFRSVAMSKPDKENIAEVTLYSQGFTKARELSKQVVPFFDSCLAQMSKQSHYDFGLRALKSVLVSSGGLKRAQLLAQGNSMEVDDALEPQIIVQSLRETIGPKLVREDAIVMEDIEAAAFPGVKYIPAALDTLKDAIVKVADAHNIVVNDNWMTKAIQLYQIQRLHHGLMMVGNSGAGKSATWKVLLQALQDTEGIEGVSYVVDPKVMSKEALYGSLDSTTREWTDGLFTSILRKIIDNLRGESAKRHWIVFDGDVDPEWVENLNSVLDDNKLLTLPNGERLVLPPNVRILFEVESLKYATLATVSRCGMVWFNDDNVTSHMMIANYIKRLRTVPFEDIEEDTGPTIQSVPKIIDTQAQVADVLESQLSQEDFVQAVFDAAAGLSHIMSFTEVRALGTFFSLLNQTCRLVLEYNAQHSDFPLQPEQVETFVLRRMSLALVWSMAGDSPLTDRQQFGARISSLTAIDLPNAGGEQSLIDFTVDPPEGEWIAWQDRVPSIEVNTHSVTQTDVVIPTLDTVRHEDVLYQWLADHKPLLLCGPPGSGKTMTLFSALRKLPDYEVVGLNFSSATTPDLLLKSFEQHCEYRKTPNGVILSPTQIGRWLVIFCDEINLPAADKYGTQRVIAFLRQLIECNGFWRTSDKTWVSLERIQFVGACNPPTDAGRVALGHRFLRHAPVVMVDYPGQQSLIQIYGTFNDAVLKIISSLRGFASPLTQAMVQLYLESQQRFTPKIQPHYVYSPRELTRWVRGIYEALKPLEHLDLEGLVRIWAHEALRLFQDRLIGDDERRWTNDSIRRIALEHFPTIDVEKALGGPILFSNWLSKNYVPVQQDALRDYVKERLRTFCEEEVDVPLVLYDDALDHVLRIDRVFRQPQGHVILIGVSGSGKTTLSRFVAWMNGMKVFQIKVHSKYSSEDFDEDLRTVLRRCGCKGEKICFVMDESNVLDSAFLERMNTLLANAEVPGLFEGDEYAALMTACKEGAARSGLMLDSQDELYKWFTQQIVKNLHVVFTMNPPEDGLGGKAATSPALFNRCVLNWFGDWSDQAFFQVGSALTHQLDLDRSNYSAPDTIPLAYKDLNLPPSHREAVVNAMVYIHHSLHQFNTRLQRQQNKVTFLTPRHFLDFVAQYQRLFSDKREDLEEQQRHLNVGLEKLKDTVEKVRELRKSLASKKSQLEVKDKEANEKLQSMINDQQSAESQKATSLEVQVQLEKQEKEVAERKEVVRQDLANAEPAVAEAAKSVSNIKRQQLTEVRSMGSPPAGVKLALEAVCTLLGHKAADWKSIQAIVRRDDFIASIVNYDNEKQMTASHRTKMRNEFLSKEDFSFERVNRASKACGPLVQWVTAQVQYSEILDRVGPLREEVSQLDEKALDTRARAKVLDEKIKQLEDSIAVYKNEYAALISEVQAIKNEMSRVEQKVQRSLHLIDSLSSERKRWEEGSKSFETQIDTIVGDTLAAAAFLAYGGLYDQQYRKLMLEDWLHHLQLSGIPLKANNPMSEYLSTADERLQWQENSLPVDDLCTENAIILKNYNRYPLIIDPSGRIVEFLQKENHERKLTVTSFLDDNFTKQVESALRFGNPILIQDAEYMDPVLNHVLNREYQKTGGRVLIQLGKQEIDFSPSFKLYLLTRDPSATFAPDICSRTTFVNFTVTQSSLQTQSLNDVLKSERPDVDERRSNLIKMQGDFRIHLRRLEKRLLQALNESRGNILDDDAVVDTLETVKKEVAEITTKVAETDGVMAEVDEITNEYKVIASSCSAIFAVLEQLRHINHFYQFSLQYFVDIFESVLSSGKDSVGRGDYKSRVASITKSLFATTYRRTSIGLLQKDRPTFAILLAQAAPYKLDSALFDALLDVDVPFIDVSSSDVPRKTIIANAKQQPLLHNALESADDVAWDKFLGEEAAEKNVPMEESEKDLNSYLRSILLTKMSRADRLVPAAERFVLQVFGPGLFEDAGDLNELIEQISAKTPIALACSPGFDASFKVDNVVNRRKVRCNNIAMGSAESLSSADKAISEAAATGSWVFIKNVHLALTWLQGVEKRLDSLKPHRDFRLFLSMECNPKIPVNLLRISRVLMAEQPAGIRANIKDSLLPSASRATAAPIERGRCYLLLSLLHGIIAERLRYAPTLGWSASWEFNDSDYDCAAHIVDTWIDWVGHGRSNVAPQAIPWEMIRALIVACYGGKIDSEKDYRWLTQLVDSLMVPETFDEGFDVRKAVAMEDTAPVEGASGFMLPASASWQQAEQWVSALPEREPPSYLGLPENAEKLLLVEHGRDMVRSMGKVMEILDESEQIMAEAEDMAPAA